MGFISTEGRATCHLSWQVGYASRVDPHNEKGRPQWL